jgi:hypothetical protein
MNCMTFSRRDQVAHEQAEGGEDQRAAQQAIATPTHSPVRVGAADRAGEQHEHDRTMPSSTRRSTLPST